MHFERIIYEQALLLAENGFVCMPNQIGWRRLPQYWILWHCLQCDPESGYLLPATMIRKGPLIDCYWEPSNDSIDIWTGKRLPLGFRPNY